MLAEDGCAVSAVSLSPSARWSPGFAVAQKKQALADSSVISSIPSWLLRAGQGFYTIAGCPKAKAAPIHGGKGKRPVIYKGAPLPHCIAHSKGWLSQQTSHLCEEEGTAERAVEDIFIQKFIYGSFQGFLANKIFGNSGPTR
ncbi:hypothetical protein JRQ81_018452 [Phrynocephalus forsythii]|uniref:Uncharacterized protein n=1 Tax=Phrynocephalus forsythii TaxID=171643 RepID=A0A9Q0XP83_9SAUR|nr:hypothetical protein JRQ81_018452 [Phrynocephalus forsythii]